MTIQYSVWQRNHADDTWRYLLTVSDPVAIMFVMAEVRSERPEVEFRIIRRKKDFVHDDDIEKIL